MPLRPESLNTGKGLTDGWFGRRGKEMKFRNLILLALWITAVSWAATEPVGVYRAEVTADRVNVRARPSLQAEVIGQLNRGEQVKVVGEILTLKNQEKEPKILWRLIQLPSRFHVWVYASYVDPATGEVKASKLNVRSGPSFLHAVVGRVPKGTRLKILGRQGIWLRIQPPEGTYGYVYDAYLRPLEGETLPAAPPPEKTLSIKSGKKTTKAQAAPRKTEKAPSFTPSKAQNKQSKQNQSAQKAAGKPAKPKPPAKNHNKPKSETSSSPKANQKSASLAASQPKTSLKSSSGGQKSATKPAASTGKKKANPRERASNKPKTAAKPSKPSLIPPVPPQVSKPIPVSSSSASPPARRRVEEAKRQKVSGPALLAVAGSRIQRTSSTRSGSTVEPQVRTSSSAKPIPVGPYASYVPGQARYVCREGIVKYTLSPKAPGAYQLVDPDTGDRLAFLYPGKPSIRIAPFHKQRVIVEGDEYREPRWPNDTVIFVRRIRLAP